MNKLIAAASAFGLFTAALWGGSLATAATSQAAPCMTPGGWGNNGFGGGVRARAKYAAAGRAAPTKAALLARAVEDGILGLDEL